MDIVHALQHTYSCVTGTSEAQTDELSTCTLIEHLLFIAEEGPTAQSFIGELVMAVHTAAEAYTGAATACTERSHTFIEVLSSNFYALTLLLLHRPLLADAALREPESRLALLAATLHASVALVQFMHSQLGTAVRGEGELNGKQKCVAVSLYGHQLHSMLVTEGSSLLVALLGLLEELEGLKLTEKQSDGTERSVDGEGSGSASNGHRLARIVEDPVLYPACWAAASCVLRHLNPFLYCDPLEPAATLVAPEAPSQKHCKGSNYRDEDLMMESTHCPPALVDPGLLTWTVRVLQSATPTAPMLHGDVSVGTRHMALRVAYGMVLTDGCVWSENGNAKAHQRARRLLLLPHVRALLQLAAGEGRHEGAEKECSSHCVIGAALTVDEKRMAEEMLLYASRF